MGYSVDVTVPGSEGQIFAPVGLSLPQAECIGCTVTGGSLRRLIEPTSGQGILLVDPEAPEVTFHYAFADHPGQYPEAIFHPALSRYTRAAPALITEARSIAGEGDDLTRAIRIARAVAERIDYGHPEQKFTDGFDHVPRLACGLTEGSCVDIHTYFLASLRAAGIEAGYVVGYFSPEVVDCTSGHCWVALPGSTGRRRSGTFRISCRSGGATLALR